MCEKKKLIEIPFANCYHCLQKARSGKDSDEA